MSKKSKINLPPVPTDPTQIRFNINGGAYRYDTSPERCAEALGGRLMARQPGSALVKLHGGAVLEITWEEKP